MHHPEPEPEPSPNRQSHTVPEWDQWFFDLVAVAATRSKDPRTKVGCVLVGPANQVLSLGYNGFPRGVLDTPERWNDRPTKLLFVEHAERNAIYNAARHGTALVGARAYVSGCPCIECARALVQVGIAEVVIDHRPSNPWRWRDDWNMDTSRLIFAEAGVRLREWCPPDHGCYTASQG